MLTGRRGKSKYRLIFVIHGLDDKQTFYHAFHSIELDVVTPLFRGFLLRTVFLCEPVALTLEVGVVIDIKVYMLVMGERESQDIIALYLCRLGGAVVRGQFHFWVPDFVVYRYKHI